MARREGEAFIEVHADTSPFAREAEAGVRRGSEAAEDELQETGDKWGETLADAMGDRLTKEGPNLAKSVDRGLSKQKVSVPVEVEFDRDRSSVRRSINNVFEEIEEAVREVAGGGGGGAGGGFGGIGRAFSDALGAGFNVSGRSPLIAFLVPLVGAVIGLVGAAIQALNALAAVAITLPGIFAAVGIQVGVLAIAFQGMGTAIQGAFSATTAKELDEALKNLTPSAQAFVKELLPLKDFFFQLRGQVQEGFFAQLEGVFTSIYRNLGPSVFDGFIKVAAALGTFLADLGRFLAVGGNFKKFLDEIFPRTVTFLEKFGPDFISFLDGLLNLVNAAMPFLTKVGDIIGMVFKQVGDAFNEVASDPEFIKWLEDMEETLMSVIQLFRAAGIFIGALFTAVDKAGGQDVIDKFAEALIVLAVFLSSETGIKGIAALLDIAILSIQAITAFIIVAIAALAAIREFFIFLKDVVLPAVGDFFAAAGTAIGDFFSWAFTKVKEFWDFLWWVFVGGGINEVMASIRGKFEAIGGFLTSWVQRIKDWFGGIPDRVKEVFSNAVSFLYNAGRNIIQGLINGIRDMFGSLRNALGFVGGLIGSFFPHSPAEQGPLSGKGDPRVAGQTIIQRVATGMEMEAPSLRDASASATQNIVFGANSIQMRINGPMSEDQARAAGRGVAEGIYGNLNRNTRLAIRTM